MIATDPFGRVVTAVDGDLLLVEDRDPEPIPEPIVERPRKRTTAHSF